jgi:D-3-phosphoglycerate dehydrogenase
VYGSTVGLIGSGTIGRAVIRRLGGFGCTILVTDPALDEPLPSTELVALHELLDRSDAVSLHVPLLDSTRGLISTDELARMKATAVLVNASRGHIVDETALYDALVSGEIAGAGLDVFAQEPPYDSPLLELPNVVATPHVGGLSHRAITAMTERATQSVVAVLEGRLPSDAINPAAMDNFPRPATNHPN